MTVESVTYITDLNATYPAAGDYGSEGDDHIRNIKTALGNTFANFTGAAVTATEAELNILDGVTASAAELNILDGVTASAAELNYLDITTLGTAENSKVLTVDGSGNWTAAGKTCADLGTITTVDINGGTANGLSSISGSSGASITEFSTDGTMAGNSDTAVPTEQAVKTYVDTNGSVSTFLTATGSSDTSVSGTYGVIATTASATIPTSGLIGLKSLYAYINAGTLGSNTNIELGFRINSVNHWFGYDQNGTFIEARIAQLASNTYRDFIGPMSSIDNMIMYFDIAGSGIATGSQTISVIAKTDDGETVTWRGATQHVSRFVIEIIDLT